ncbi:MAG TPA: heterodisulfide reductase subunit B [Thermoflexia bacterium]|nr:heterodisulfide reductase subunit B [Thermoflexia bacterium]
MKFAYYPGCTIGTTAVEFGLSTDAVCEALEVELVELEDWNCCGASSAHSLDHELSLRLPARNVALAQGTGLDIVAPCPACYQHILAADIKLREDEEWRREMEGVLGFTYDGEGRPRHLLEVLSTPEMIEAVRQKVTRPLEGLRVVSYYGCVLVRPPEITGWDDPEHPVRMDLLMEAIGAEPVDWSYKVDCCGASLALSRSDVVTTLSTRLAEAAREAGADVIACACGMCQINLDTRQALEERVPVLYFTELMGLAFGLPGVGKWLGKHTVDPRPVLRERGILP